MLKATLILLASCSIFGAAVLVSHPASAAEIVSPAFVPVLSAPAAQVRENPVLHLAARESNPILEQLGCKCAACTQAGNQLQGKLPF
ncbi:MAG: hypothetical protein KME26_04285 [Oscillatoria princeps RMCB-10]|nr:hypothetical protein [Oscillatoria princeps RMCB-10]